MKQKYAIHGSANICRENNIIIIDAVGPWNQESVVDSRVFFEQAYKDLAGKHWGMIVKLNGEVGHTPKATELLVDAIKQDKLRGRVKTALIISESEFPSFSKDHITNVYNRAQEEFQFFETMATAKKWLKAELAKLD